MHRDGPPCRSWPLWGTGVDVPRLGEARGVGDYTFQIWKLYSMRPRHWRGALTQGDAVCEVWRGRDALSSIRSKFGSWTSSFACAYAFGVLAPYLITYLIVLDVLIHVGCIRTTVFDAYLYHCQVRANTRQIRANTRIGGKTSPIWRENVPPSPVT